MKLLTGLKNGLIKTGNFTKDHKVPLVGGTLIFLGLSLFAGIGGYSPDGLGWWVEHVQTIPTHVYELHLNPILHPISYLLGEGVLTYIGKLMEGAVTSHFFSRIKNLPYHITLSYGSVFLAEKIYKKVRARNRSHLDSLGLF